MKKLISFLLLGLLTFGCAGLQSKGDDQLERDMAAATESAGKWSDYGLMGTATIADDDTFMVKDLSVTALGPTGTQKQYKWSSLKTDLSIFDSFEFPNANDTTTVADAQAEAGHDNDDFAIAVHDNTNVRYYATRTKCLPPVVIEEPDAVQAISDTQPMYSFPAEQYPAGVVIEAIHITTSATCTDTIDFREYSQNGTSWTNQSQIESITLSGVYTQDDGTLADSVIAVDREIWINMDDSSDDIAWLKIQVCIQIPVNN